MDYDKEDLYKAAGLIEAGAISRAADQFTRYNDIQIEIACLKYDISPDGRDEWLKRHTVVTEQEDNND